MKINSIKTDKIRPFDRSIFSVLDASIADMPERSILVITSKIVSICENNVVKKTMSKKDFAKQEADLYLPEIHNNHNYLLTIKNNILIANAGVDESNVENHYVLWPKDPQKSANDILDYLKDKFGRKEIGVIISDSKTTPLHRGISGVAIAYSGFSPLKNYIGKSDLFGFKLGVTKAAIYDSLAVAAVIVMGEGDEQTPMALIEDLPFVEFQDSHPSQAELDELNISLEDDLYAELLTSVDWQTKKKS